MTTRVPQGLSIGIHVYSGKISAWSDNCLDCKTKTGSGMFRYSHSARLVCTPCGSESMWHSCQPVSNQDPGFPGGVSPDENTPNLLFTTRNPLLIRYGFLSGRSLHILASIYVSSNSIATSVTTTANHMSAVTDKQRQALLVKCCLAKCGHYLDAVRGVC